MWLLRTDTIELKYFQTADPEKAPYAILSHTWEDDEVSFRDMQTRTVAEKKKGFDKILNCCQQARRDGYAYAWVDTCCIDKSSSAELSESINSMYAWYQKASVCYAYLSDVERLEVKFSRKALLEHLKHSRWFTRGWTLQELLAPENLVFFARDWTVLGTRFSLCATINDITNIAVKALLGIPLRQFNVAERMSWAAHRKTTRVEDVAYSLLGIFDVNMPLLYGEGDRAFIRLQEQIIESNEDYTIFAWGGHWDGRDYAEILAPSPDRFHTMWIGAITYAQLSPKPKVPLESPGPNTHRWSGDDSPPAVTSRGIKMRMRCDIKVEDGRKFGTMVLCSVESTDKGEPSWLGLKLVWPSTGKDQYSATAIRDDEALGPVLELLQDLPASMEEIYALSKHVKHDLAGSPTRLRDSVLRRIDQELLASLPSLDPLVLARWLLARRWCASCDKYVLACPDHKCGGLEDRMMLTQEFERPYPEVSSRMLRPRRSSECNPNEDEFEDDSIDFLDCLDNRDCYGDLISHIDFPEYYDNFSKGSDAELRRVESMLSISCGKLRARLMKLVLCSFLAKNITLRVAKSLNEADKGRKFESYVSKPFLRHLDQCLEQNYPVGYATMAMTTRSPSEICGNAQDPVNLAQASLDAYIISCGNELAVTSDVDQFVVDIAQATFVINYGKMFEEAIAYSPPLDKEFNAFKRPHQVLCGLSGLIGPAQPLDPPEKFVAWLRDIFQPWV